MSKLKIITTEDGSHSLYHNELNETYHSFHGALTESKYVFIEKGLRYWRVKEGLPQAVRVLEIGFGTGLNALLSYQFAKENAIDLHYTSLEPFPIEPSIIQQLNYHLQLQGDASKTDFDAIHEVDWNEAVVLSENFKLEKQETTFQNFETDKNYDIIFFDAFAPSKQAEMWELALMQKCYELLNEKGVFVTYSARGQLKRDLKSAGFSVETLPGPPGKKEMVRAEKK
jgi:tRNA U34 5-methylaminomethyl-2-thiouridine-forming methyltransferase MnmC